MGRASEKGGILEFERVSPWGSSRLLNMTAEEYQVIFNMTDTHTFIWEIAQTIIRHLRLCVLCTLSFLDVMNIRSTRLSNLWVSQSRTQLQETYTRGPTSLESSTCWTVPLKHKAMAGIYGRNYWAIFELPAFRKKYLTSCKVLKIAAHKLEVVR